MTHIADDDVLLIYFSFAAKRSPKKNSYIIISNMSHRRGESGRSCIICKANSSCFWRRFIEREGKFYAGKSYEWISSPLPPLIQAPPGGMYLCNDCYAKNQRAVRKLKPKEFQEKEREYREAAKAKKREIENRRKKSCNTQEAT